MSQKILMISALAGAEDCAHVLSGQLGMPVEVAKSHKAAISALRHREYAAMIVDDSLAEADPVAADLLWKHSGLAVPLQINFAISSSSRLARDVRAALARRQREHALALRSAASALESELKTTVTGLLLQSQLALAEPELTPQLTGKLKLVAELANTLRRRLDHSETLPNA